MPIKIACKCGQRLTAKDELAGKRVKCPKCGQQLAIPQPGGTPAATQKRSADVAKGAIGDKRLPAGRSSRAATSSVDQLLEEAGLISAAQHCPNCRAAMAPEAVLCLECGFNVKLGKVMQTRAVTEEEEQGPTSRTAGDWKSRAERALIEDAESKRKESSAGFPWYVYLIILFGLILFTGGMMMISPVTVMKYAGITLIALGALATTIGGLWLLVEAFRISIVQGLLCFTLLYVPIFAIMHWDDATTPAIIWFGGVGLALAGLGMYYISPYMDFAGGDSASAMPTIHMAAASVLAIF